jgi:hypothetical protein
MRCTGVLVVLSGVGGSLAAQSSPADLDRRVWVRELGGNGTYSHGVKGTLERTSGDTLFVRPDNGAAAFAVPPRGGRKILFFNGRRSSVGQGLLIGTGVGVAAGAILGFAGGQDCSADEWLCFDRGTTAAMGGLLLGAGGLVVGMIAGSLSSHEVWTSEQPGRLRPLVGPTRRGIGVGMSVSF